MSYQGGYCSTIMNTRSLPALPGFATAQKLARLVMRYEISLPTPPVRVLISGDHATLRSSLKTMLELDPRIQVVGEAADDCETIKMACKLRPDVVLMDLDMRCCDDYEAVAEITNRQLASAIVALTIHDDQTERSLAQAAGVDLFLEKGVPYKQLISAVRLAAANKQNR